MQPKPMAHEAETDVLPRSIKTAQVQQVNVMQQSLFWCTSPPSDFGISSMSGCLASKDRSSMNLSRSWDSSCLSSICLAAAAATSLEPHLWRLPAEHRLAACG